MNMNKSIRHAIKSIFLINNLMKIKGRVWDRGRCGRQAETILRKLEVKIKDKTNKFGKTKN